MKVGTQSDLSSRAKSTSKSHSHKTNGAEQMNSQSKQILMAVHVSISHQYWNIDTRISLLPDSLVPLQKSELGKTHDQSQMNFTEPPDERMNDYTYGTLPLNTQLSLEHCKSEPPSMPNLDSRQTRQEIDSNLGKGFLRKQPVWYSCSNQQLLASMPHEVGPDETQFC